MAKASSLRWRHNERDGISNHRRLHCLLNPLWRPRSKKTSKLRVTGLCGGNPPVTGGFPSQMASNAEYVPIWWRHIDNSHIHRQPSKLISPQIARFVWANLGQPVSFRPQVPPHFSIDVAAILALLIHCDITHDIFYKKNPLSEMTK